MNCMIAPEHIDLHMHSTVSDGTDTPLELLDQVTRVGIELFALTDHDAMAGSEMILNELEKEKAAGSTPGPRFLPGVEFSCKDNYGKYHILGYGYDPGSESIRAVIGRGHALRMSKLQGRLDFLRDQFGFAFSEEDMDALKHLPNPGKPHIGNLMVRYGYARSKGEAITEFINKKHFTDGHIRPEEAIAGIVKAGGVPVLAHPSYGDGDQIIVGDEMRARIVRLLDMGIEGLEAYYSGFTPKLQNEILGFADEYHLYVTAGSDYHGKNKLIPIGETNLEKGDEPAEGLYRFLERVVKDELSG